MKAENETTGHNRTIRLTDIPVTDKDGKGLGLLPELVITVNYATVPNDGNVLTKAVTLDSIVIPEIIRAINNCGQLDGFFRGVTGPVG